MRKGLLLALMVLLTASTPAAAVQTVCGWAGDTRAFVKVGDSITASPAYLSPFGNRDAVQIEPSLSHLWLVLGYWRQGSFERTSMAAVNGMTSQGLLDPARCNGRTPLQCEYDQMNARTAIIMIGTNDPPEWTESQFSQRNIETIVQITLERGMVPVLWTLPPNRNKSIEPLNGFIRQLAQKYGLLLIESSSVGLAEDGVHPSIAPAGLEAVLHPSLYGYGQTTRNRLTLQALYDLRVRCQWY